MWISLEELLEKFVSYEKLVIFNEVENIEDKYKEDEIPKEWLDKIVRDFEFHFGTLWVKI